ncbi:hypothetical protein P1J78_21870 [Psychromarinibacter sp. C21-152]|uniref:Uncharacterized protein n=1 Tax=Psychromarinibacter sediminicola TaxID=3033385 RepID=A0AAE3TB08_9RHOB|nr:hypothetical protein [Psychromarinibacter sediminicola]MDF0603383.1 hypothetical protein [Psychromarinibacter sediminicola]
MWENRASLEEDNLSLRAEQTLHEWIYQAVSGWRDVRGAWVEQPFLAFYGRTLGKGPFETNR